MFNNILQPIVYIEEHTISNKLMRAYIIGVVDVGII